MNLKKIGKVFTSKSVGTGPSSYEKRIYWAAVSQGLRTKLVIITLIFLYFRLKFEENYMGESQTVRTV